MLAVSSVALIWTQWSDTLAWVTGKVYSLFKSTATSIRGPAQPGEAPKMGLLNKNGMCICVAVTWTFFWALLLFENLLESYAQTPKPNYEAPCRLAQKAGGWLAGEIWPKSAWPTSRLKLPFYNFCRFQVQLVGVAQELQKVMNNTVYCL